MSSSVAPVRKLASIRLDASMDVETAARTVFLGCTRHLKKNFRNFRETGDPMALMQIRIGVRRMRVALHAFRPIVPKKMRGFFNREYRYFGDLLGDARNMDVFLTGVLRLDRESAGFADVSRTLLRLGEEMRQREYDSLAREISSGHFERIGADFDKWLDADWSDHLGRSKRKILRGPIAPFALAVIEEGNRELLDRGATLHSLSVGDLHDLRKYVKRARYHLRFFGGLLRDEKVAEGFRLLIPMQSCLGLINDMHEGILILDRLSAAAPASAFAETLRFTAHVHERVSTRAAENFTAFLALWREYEDFSIGVADLRAPA